MEKYSVTGMSCAACVSRVEKAVSRVAGVSSCTVSLLTNSMGVEGSAKPSEIIGSMGPTTSHRMDKFLAEFPQVKATMGKGARSKAAEDFIRANNSVYFEIEGGISTLLASCFEKYEPLAFKELSTEAVSLAKIKKLPAKVVISANR